MSKRSRSWLPPPLTFTMAIVADNQSVKVAKVDGLNVERIFLALLELDLVGQRVVELTSASIAPAAIQLQVDVGLTVGSWHAAGKHVDLVDEHCTHHISESRNCAISRMLNCSICSTLIVSLIPNITLAKFDNCPSLGSILLFATMYLHNESSFSSPRVLIKQKILLTTHMNLTMS